MRPQDNFNIITGQVKRPLPMNSNSKRFQSMDLIKNEKLKGAYNYELVPQKKLGKAKDDKMFTYTYTDNDPINNIYQTKTQSFQKSDNFNNTAMSQNKTSLINATKQQYNIISNTYQPSNTNNWTNPKRMFPISKNYHNGRTNAPNYTQNYEQRQAQKQFIKKRNLCTDICEIQKNYGTEKFFRKFK